MPATVKTDVRNSGVLALLANPAAELVVRPPVDAAYTIDAYDFSTLDGRLLYNTSGPEAEARSCGLYSCAYAKQRDGRVEVLTYTGRCPDVMRQHHNHATDLCRRIVRTPPPTCLSQGDPPRIDQIRHDSPTTSVAMAPTSAYLADASTSMYNPTPSAPVTNPTSATAGSRVVLA